MGRKLRNGKGMLKGVGKKIEPWWGMESCKEGAKSGEKNDTKKGDMIGRRR